MTADTAPMSLDEDVVSTEGAAAKDTDGVPYCRVHHCRMEQKSGGKKSSPTVYYGCKVEGCEEKAQRIKTKNEGIVPPQPLPCARCSKGGKPVYCERDPKSSTPASVILKCPRCGWKSNAMVVPALAAAHLASRHRERPTAPDLGAR